VHASGENGRAAITSGPNVPGAVRNDHPKTPIPLDRVPALTSSGFMGNTERGSEGRGMRVIGHARIRRAGAWTEAEDKVLLHYHAEGLSWKQVSERIPGRNTKSCRERFRNQLDPKINWGHWSQEEDDLLRKGFATHGSKWSKVAQRLSGRTQLQIRDRWRILEKGKQQLWSAQAKLPTSTSTPPPPPPGGVILARNPLDASQRESEISFAAAAVMQTQRGTGDCSENRNWAVNPPPLLPSEGGYSYSPADKKSGVAWGESEETSDFSGLETRYSLDSLKALSLCMACEEHEGWPEEQQGHLEEDVKKHGIEGTCAVHDGSKGTDGRRDGMCHHEPIKMDLGHQRDSTTTRMAEIASLLAAPITVEEAKMLHTE